MTDHPLLLGIALPADDFARLPERIRIAEQIGLNFALFEDPPGAPGRRPGLDPVELAAFAGARSDAIALIAGAPATHAEPFHLSNQFSSLDWGTRGRAGWLVTVDATSARAQAYSADAPDPDRARREAAAVVEAARQLWDSWEDEALLADPATGRFLDHRRIHYVDAQQEFFDIRGPALMPRPVQGQVVVLGRYRHGIAGPDVSVVGGVAESKLARAAGAARTISEILSSPGLLTSLRRLAGHVDGVVIHARNPESALEELHRYVVPALTADGVLAPPRPGQTLREQLGLPRPVSRYAATPQTPVSPPDPSIAGAR